MTPNPTAHVSYERSGVARLDNRPGFKSLIAQLGETFKLRPTVGKSLLDFGCYASILDIGLPQAIAISTDGIGTKAIIAQMVDRYDTVGIDCVAMNANDVLCVGAEPISMLDYIAVEVAGDRFLEEIGAGLLEGARQANITIPGGEISQIPEIIRSQRPEYGFDLVGTCVGLVDKQRIIDGRHVQPGDAIVGLASTGIHSNGLTLARRVLLEGAGMDLADQVAELGKTLGDELLEPTRIYIKAVMPMLQDEVNVTALCHVTSDGFMNLTRVPVNVGFEIEHLPEPPAIFEMIRSLGPVPNEEMYRVYNMGVGFCVVCAPEAVPGVIGHARAAGVEGWEIGRVVEDARKRVWLREQGLVGENGEFVRVDRSQ